MAYLLQLALAATLCSSLAIAAPRDHSVSWNINAAQPVNVTILYEALCGGCKHLLLKSVIPAWEKTKDLNFMNVDLRPYGNAKEKFEGGEWKFECQHGVHECEGNVLETCIIHHYPNATKQLEAIKCIEDDFSTTAASDWEKTLKKCAYTGVDVEKVSKCAKGKEGNELQHQMALLTGPHEYVPWTMLDGVFNENAFTHFVREVCKAYKGTPPAICNDA